MALALYRRYRPDTFSGVIGQDQVTVPLGRALDQGKLTHAYLFSGPRGCGKTSCARILARCVNCAKGPTSHPCGECDSCRDLATGGPGSIDVVEIDAASHNGVDDARELRERAGFAPARDRYKIFILDEAHMVTQQGFNAMLKIVEEPPEHVMFIFATTEPEKVIGTIRSRTHHYPFRLVPPEVMGPYLEEVCSKEGIQTQQGVLRLAMRAGGGSMRDTLSVLDQLMVGAQDNTVTLDSAVALLGFTPETLIGEAVDAVIDCDGEKLYGVVQKVVVGGFDPRRFVEDLLSRVRDLLVLTLGGQRAQSVLSDDAEAESMQELERQASSLGLQALTQMAQIINEAVASMSGATSPRMRLELLAAKLLAYRFGEEEAASAPSAGGQAQVAESVPHPRSKGGFVGSRRSETASSGPVSSGPAPSEAVSSGAVPPQSSSPQSSPAHPASTEPRPAPVNTSGDGSAPQTQQDDASTRQAASTQSDRGQGSTSATDAGTGEMAGTGEKTGEAEAVASSSPVEAKASAGPSYGSVDEQWDAVVKELPQDVKEYVSRDKVPSVALDVSTSGRQRLRMTFDTPLSQHAFALAVASEAVGGETSIPKIVLLMVKHSFGAQTFIAPSPTAADGEAVESTRKMSPEQLADIKRRIALDKAGLSAANLGMTGKVAGKPTGNAANTAQHDAAGSRARNASSNAKAPVARSGDTTIGGQDDGGQDDDAAHHRGGHVARPADDVDPWATPQRMPDEAAPGTDQERIPEHHVKKSVSVPDLSDDSDPWLNPSTSAKAVSTGQTASDDPRQSQDDGGRDDGLQTEQHFVGNSAAGAFHADKPRPEIAEEDKAPAGVHGGTANGETAGPANPPVSAEDDVYTMHDKALNSGTALDLDALKQMFDVKQVETFDSDDPLNPINVEHSKQQGHE